MMVHLSGKSVTTMVKTYPYWFDCEWPFNGISPRTAVHLSSGKRWWRNGAGLALLWTTVVCRRNFPSTCAYLFVGVSFCDALAIHLKCDCKVLLFSPLFVAIRKTVYKLSRELDLIRIVSGERTLLPPIPLHWTWTTQWQSYASLHPTNWRIPKTLRLTVLSSLQADSYPECPSLQWND